MDHRIARAVAVAATVFAAAGSAAAQTDAVAAVQSVPQASNDTKWVVDLVHSQVEFGIRHLIGRVRGSFSRWYGLISTQDRDWRHGTVKVQVRTASINTGNTYRDADLRSPRFLDVERFPQMTFESTEITTRDSTIELRGTLTLRGQSHPVVLKGTFRGIGKDLEGKERIAFEAGTHLNRHDYGINYNQLVEGTSVVGDDVEINVALEAVRAN